MTTAPRSPSTTTTSSCSATPTCPTSPQLESPKPYLHPIRTRSGPPGEPLPPARPRVAQGHRVVAARGRRRELLGRTDLRPRPGLRAAAERRHAGAPARSTTSTSMPTGPRGSSHDLEWITEGGARLFTERRAIGARVLDDDSWVLTFETAMTNVSASDIAIGSPTTKGRENAGYGGLFWRGPRSFTGGTLVTADGTGHGQRRPRAAARVDGLRRAARRGRRVVAHRDGRRRRRTRIIRRSGSPAPRSSPV